MHESVIRELQVLRSIWLELLPSLSILANKWWVRRVPAAAVTPAPRVAISFIGSKAFVAGFVSLL